MTQTPRARHNMRAADPDNNKRSGASPSSTPPLHAEVRAAIIEQIGRMWDAGIDYALSPDFKELTPDEKDALYERYKTNVGNQVADAILQAVADALLAAIQPLKDKPEKYVRMNSECLEGHTIALDAVTRVIGELRGSNPIGEKNGDSN